MNRILTLLVVLVVAVAVTGCGSEEPKTPGSSAPTANEPSAPDKASEPAGDVLSESEYIKQVNAAQSEFATASGKLNLANPSGPKDFKNSLDKVGVLVDKLVSDLEGITPPETVQRQHRKLIDIMSGYGDALEKNKGGLTSSDPTIIKRAATGIQKASNVFAKDFDATINDVNRVIKP